MQLTTEEKIRVLLKRKGLTMKDVAELIGVHQNNISIFVGGRARSVKVARALIEVGIPEDIVEDHLENAFPQKRRGPRSCG